MGRLYDGYKVAFQSANQVQQFRGGMADDIARIQPELMERYERVAQALPELDEVVSTAPFIEGVDDEKWADIRSNADMKLGEWSQREDLENIGTDVSRYARQVTGQLGNLAKQVKNKQAYDASLDDEKLELPQLVKDAKRAQALDAYKANGGASVDKYGRPTNNFNGAPAVKHIDNNKKIREVLSIAMPELDASSITQDGVNGMWRATVDGEVKWLDPNKVRKAIQDGINSDLNWSESIEQDISASTYLNTRNFENLSDSDISEYVNSKGSDGMKVAFAKLTENGAMSAKDAMKQITQKANSDKMYNNIFGYGHSKSYQETTDKVSNTYDSLYTAEVARQKGIIDEQTRHDRDRDEKKADEAEARARESATSDENFITMPSQNFDVAPDYKSFSNQRKTLSASIDEARNIAGQWIELKADGTPILDAKGNPTMKAGRNMSDLPANAIEAMQTLNHSVPELDAINKQEKSLLDQAAVESDPTLANADGTFDGAYDRINKKWDNKLVDDLNKFDKADKFTVIPLKNSIEITNAKEKLVDRKLFGKGTKKAVTLADLRKAAAEGRVKQSYVNNESTPYYTVMGTDGKPAYRIPFSGSQHNFHVPGGKNAPSDRLAKEASVRKLTESNYEKYSKNNSSVAPVVSMPIKDTKTKSMAHNLVSAIAGSKGAITFKDSENETIDRDDFNTIITSKVSNVAVFKAGNNVRVVLTSPGEDGTEKTTTAILPAQSDASEKLFNRFITSPNKGVREAAMHFNPNSQIPQLQTMQVDKDVPVKVPAGRGKLWYRKVRTQGSSYYRLMTLNDEGKKVPVRNLDIIKGGNNLAYQTKSPADIELRVLEQLGIVKDDD